MNLRSSGSHELTGTPLKWPIWLGADRRADDGILRQAPSASSDQEGCMFLAKLFRVVMVAGLLLVAPACTGLRPTRSGRRTGAPIRDGCAMPRR